MIHSVLDSPGKRQIWGIEPASRNMQLQIAAKPSFLLPHSEYKQTKLLRLEQIALILLIRINAGEEALTRRYRSLKVVWRVIYVIIRFAGLFPLLFLQYWRDNTALHLYTRCGKKVAPQSFSLFSQQPFEILIWNFTLLFSKTFYI